LLEGFSELTSAAAGADQQTKRLARERMARFYVDTNQRDKLNALDLVSSHDATAAASRPK
jgi:hypothetical protein